MEFYLHNLAITPIILNKDFLELKSKILMTKFYIATIFYLFMVPIQALTQEGYGLLHGSYNGISSANLNPSNLLKSTHKWEFRFGGFHLGGQTNYAHLHKTSILDLARNNDGSNIIIDSDSNLNPRDLVFNNNQQQKFFEARATLLGPGLFFSINPFTKIGVSSSIRTMGSVFRIPTVLNYQNLEVNIRDDSVKIPERNMAGMVWEEIAIHYATFWNQVDFGVSMKLVMPLHVAYVNNVSEFDYILDLDSNLTGLTKGTLEVGFNDFDENQVTKKIGMGGALDLGWRFPKILGSKSNVGISILDIGLSRVKAKKYTLGIEQDQTINVEDYQYITDQNELLRLANEDGFQVDSTDYLTMFAPTALSIQYEIPLRKNLYFNAALVQRLKFFDNQVPRANSINGTLVYDSKHFSAFLPVSLYNYKSLRMGLAVRLAFLTIGTDKLAGTLFKDNTFNGADFYFKMDAYPFIKWKKRTKKKKEKIKGVKVKCPRL